MTLNKTWEECLRMWKWISRNGWRYTDVDAAKLFWLSKNGYSYHDFDTNPEHPNSIANGCFFCHYGTTHPKMKPADLSACPKCPASRVDKTFMCMDEAYDYEVHPKAFYRKLVELNKKRLAS